MTPILNIIKRTSHRIKFASRVFIDSFFILGFKKWFELWVINKLNKIKINSLTFRIRNNSFLSKISDVSMLFETVYYGHYSICPIKDSDVVVDIGAHIGGFSIYASKLATNGKICAFEPSMETYKYLDNNISINKIKNISYFNKAVSNKNGSLNIYLNKRNSAENSLYKISDKKQLIASTTLKKVFEENKITICDVLKLDCEGSEYEILFSSRDLLKRINRIILEYHEPKYFGIDEKYSPSSLVYYLKKNNFKIKILKDTYYQGIIYAERQDLFVH